MRISQCFPELYENSGGSIKFELEISNYATKANLKETSKADLASLKTKVDKIDIDALKIIPTYLSKLSNVVDIEYVNIVKFFRTPLL